MNVSRYARTAKQVRTLTSPINTYSSRRRHGLKLVVIESDKQRVISYDIRRMRGLPKIITTVIFKEDISRQDLFGYSESIEAVSPTPHDDVIRELTDLRLGETGPDTVLD